MAYSFSSYKTGALPCAVLIAHNNYYMLLKTAEKIVLE
jgi:hypothetical protein